MNYTPTICSICGSEVEPSSKAAICSRCSMNATLPETAAVSPVSFSAEPTQSDSVGWSALTGYLIWIASFALMLGVQMVAVIGYWFLFDRGLWAEVAKGVMSPGVIVVSLIATLIAQVMTLALCWFIVTRNGARPFLATLGWKWDPQFKLPHAIGLTILMLGVGVLASKYLPHRATDLEKMLGAGLAVRIITAILATLSAPIVEEVVYRGVIYAPLEKLHGQGMAIAIVTILFWLVHLPQYFSSVAVMVSILTLSLALTMLRAKTGQLLPCVAVHLLFNGIQSVGILFFEPDKQPEAVTTGMIAMLRTLGWL